MAATAALYGSPTMPSGKGDVVVIMSVELIMMNRLADVVCAGLAESVTVTVAVLPPAVWGTPPMIPESGLILSPAGNPVADHTY